MESIYVIEVPNKAYIELINDIIRMITIQFMIQFLFYINGPENAEFFSIDFFLLIIYIVLGVCVYWLVIKKLVDFK
jgi:hypothetical protein